VMEYYILFLQMKKTEAQRVWSALGHACMNYRASDQYPMSKHIFFTFAFYSYLYVIGEKYIPNKSRSQAIIVFLSYSQECCWWSVKKKRWISCNYCFWDSVAY
jgi:hypothetical protein